MLPDQVSNPGPLTCESGVLSIALRGPAKYVVIIHTGTKAPDKILQTLIRLL